MTRPLYITNTLSNKKELFTPYQQGKVAMYVCGITPYDYAHLGHGRCYVTFDILYRLLTFLGYKVTYCRNFTDIDDKLLDRAQHALGDPFKYRQIADQFIAAYEKDMNALNCLKPTYEPRVTDNIADIITFIERLIKAGNAYVADGDVYFSIESFPEYGKLSKRNIADLKVGARVQPNDKKRNPLDFALWKGEQDGDYWADSWNGASAFWKSPWGYGRPGWHIECSVLAYKYLGQVIDIHGGGMDLIFPHHENEIAQSEAILGIPVVRYWLHNAFVNINKEKMSKSLGNFMTLHQLFQTIDPMVVRFYYAQHYYRAPLEFTTVDLEGVTKTYKRLCALFESVDAAHVSAQQIEQSKIVARMLDYLLDDLNTSGMFGVLFEELDTLRSNESEAKAVKVFLQQVMGLPLVMPKEKEVTITPEIQRLIDEREKARVNKDFKRADEIRDRLTSLGIQIHDKKKM